MYFGYSPASLCSSVSLADLPQICDDPDCLVPFGPACLKCSRDLETRDRARHAAEKKGSRSGLAREADDEDVPEHVSDGEEGSEPARELEAGDHDGDSDPSSEASRQTLRAAPAADPAPTSSSYSCYSSSSSSSSSSVILDSPSLPERFDSWLTDIFDNTLEGQRADAHFVGGADEQDDERRCSLCAQVPAEHPELHRLRCEFAHHEAARMEEGVQRQVGRWGSSWDL